MGDAPLVQVVRLDEDRGDEAAALFGRAFQDDPLFAHACPDPGERARWLPWLFRWSTWKGLHFGELLGTGEALTGVVALIGPEGGEFTEEDLVGFDYRRGREIVGADVWDRSVNRVNVAFEPADAALHQAVSEPHWYLDAIAVEPTGQGRGIGSGLLSATAARADVDGMPIVLLTCQPRNLSLYRRYGYVVVCEGTLQGSELPWWGMRRDPGR
jgi:ribosomal protein S18 acetylase RimI-like enzyme